MNFFKKLFSSHKDTIANDKETESQSDHQDQVVTDKTSNNKNEVSMIYTEEYFAQRYVEENIHDNPKLLDGSLKMIESYFIDNLIAQNVQSPVNHPNNLDQVVEEGLGFQWYCKSFELDDQATIMFLTMGLSDFFINNFGFQLYKDNEPEFPLRSMTLKYNKNGAVLSLYPFEYALKVLNHEATFTELFDKISNHLENMPNVEDVLNNYTEKSPE